MGFLGDVLGRHSSGAVGWSKVCLASKLRPTRLAYRAPESYLGLGKYHVAKQNRTQDNRSPSDKAVAVLLISSLWTNHASVRGCREEHLNMSVGYISVQHLGVQMGALHARETDVGTEAVRINVFEAIGGGS